MSDNTKKIKENILYQENFLSEDESNSFFNILYEKGPWKEDSISMYGKTHKLPRLHFWIGPKSYMWSGVNLIPQEPLPCITYLLEKLEKDKKYVFNSVMVNLYRDGKDYIGYHSDDEDIFGQEPTIASLSLGEARDFIIRSKADHKDKTKIELQNGSLLVMSGNVQKTHQHSLPKRVRVKKPRINLTFRKVI